MPFNSKVDGVEITGQVTPGFEDILTPEALGFVADLHRKFNTTRVSLLKRRDEVQAALDGGQMPDFPKEAEEIRRGDWKVAPAPADLSDRRVEITGPVERRMMINAFNSGAKVFMADFEDALSPTWTNLVKGHINLKDAVRRTLTFTSPEGKHYELEDNIATLLVRPRGWHLPEQHVLVDGEPVSASLFDFGLFFFHNAKETLARGSGPYFYLPKLENHLEARLWNDVFNHTQDALDIPRGSIRATVLIETVLAAFEMEEILYELRDHGCSLNAGRWDYIFSIIKKFCKQSDMVLPDRAQVTMTVPFMRAYTELLVRTCHKHEAHAIGGMAAFIPSRRDPTVNEVAIPKVREDKERESGDGFDGTWVAHPDLVGVATEEFDKVLKDRPNQLGRLREEVQVQARELADFRVPGSTVTETGVRNNISVALQYMDNWLGGLGAVAIFNLMEDAATAEISRSQLWQWVHNGARLADGQTATAELYKKLRDNELEKLGGIDTRHYRDVV
ncbi:MAG: malate synthase A, partial [Acidiferrobacterales bacterium]